MNHKGDQKQQTKGQKEMLVKKSRLRDTDNRWTGDPWKSAKILRDPNYFERPFATPICDSHARFIKLTCDHAGSIFVLFRLVNPFLRKRVASDPARVNKSDAKNSVWSQVT